MFFNLQKLTQIYRPISSLRNVTLVVLFSFFSLNFCTAQIDTAYIGSFHQNFSAKIYGAYNFSSILYQHSPEPSEMFMPNVASNLGFGLSWKRVGASISFGLDFLNDSKKQDPEKSQYLDLQYHYYGKRIVFDLFGQSYKGFGTGSDTNRYFYSDLSLINIGGFIQYTFNHKRFSYRAAFDQTEKQLQSAGSPLLCLAGYYTKVDSDTLFNGTKQHYLFGPSAGYAYSWVNKNKNYFATLSLTIGFNAASENWERNSIYICPAFFPRISTGYNAPTWSIGLSAAYNIIYTEFKEYDKLGINTLSARITFIKRFHFESKTLDRLTLQSKKHTTAQKLN